MNQPLPNKNRPKPMRKKSRPTLRRTLLKNSPLNVPKPLKRLNLLSEKPKVPSSA